MREALNTMKKAAGRLKLRKAVRYAFRLAPAALGLVLQFFGIPGGLEAAEAGLFLSAGAVVVDERFLKGAEQGQPEWAAFVHDYNHIHFGWK
jgi:hypothetical protein